MWIFLFSFMFKTLRVTFDGSGFPEVDSFLVTILQTIQNSIGNLGAPDYSAWFPDDATKVQTMLENTVHAATTKSTAASFKAALEGKDINIDMIEYNTFEQQFMLYAIWFLWILNQLVNLIILLNFLIAVTGQVYDDVVGEKDFYLYSHRAEMNYEWYMIQKQFNLLKPFEIIVFSMNIELEEEEQDDWLGFVKTIKSAIAKNVA